MIKICGLTNAEDALFAADAGADALGFVFAPGRRRMTPEAVAAITAQLNDWRGPQRGSRPGARGGAPGIPVRAARPADAPPGPRRVGVFVNATAAELRAAAATAGLSALQLHGAEPPALAAELVALGLTQTELWKAAAMNQPGAEAQLAAWRPLAAALLLDGGAGGGGERFDWSRAAAFGAGGGARIVVAGGLTPDNVAGCIRLARPWGVDVSSGVEAAPGRKDAARVRDFIHAAREAFAALEVA